MRPDSGCGDPHGLQWMMTFGSLNQDSLEFREFERLRQKIIGPTLQGLHPELFIIESRNKDNLSLRGLGLQLREQIKGNLEGLLEIQQHHVDALVLEYLEKRLGRVTESQLGRVSLDGVAGGPDGGLIQIRKQD